MASRWVDVAFNPTEILRRVPLVGPIRSAYLNWWERLGLRHNPPYAFRRTIGRFRVTVASDEYTVASVEDESQSIYIANHYMVAIDGDRVLLADWTTEFVQLREILQSPEIGTGLAIKYFNDVLEIEADGDPVDFTPSPLLAD